MSVYDDMREHRIALKSEARRDVQQQGFISNRIKLEMDAAGIDAETFEQALLDHQRYEPKSWKS